AVRLGADVRQDVGAEKDACQAVVIRRRYRIEFVVVTAGAGHGQAQEGPADHVHLVVGDVGEQLLLVRVAAAPVADGQQAGGDDAVRVDAARFGGGQPVAGELLEDEAVVGQVA